MKKIHTQRAKEMNRVLLRRRRRRKQRIMKVSFVCKKKNNIVFEYLKEGKFIRCFSFYKKKNDDCQINFVLIKNEVKKRLV